METTETRAKLADAIRDLESRGDTATIGRLVSAYKQKYRTPQKPQSVLPSLTEKGIGSLPGFKQATQFGVGVGSAIGEAGLGLGQLALRGLNKVGNVLGTGKNQYDPVIQQMENIKQKVFKEPYQKELE